MISNKIAFLFGFLSAAACADSAVDYAAHIDPIFAKWTDSTPGCAVAVNKAGHLEFAKACGSADLEHAIPKLAYREVRHQELNEILRLRTITFSATNCSRRYFRGT